MDILSKIKNKTKQSVDRAPLVEYRDRLDAIDDEIMELFAKRYRVRDETMAVKVEHDMPIEVQSRVDEVIKRMVKKAEKLDVPTDFAKALYELVIDHSHQYEEQYRDMIKEEEVVS